MRRPAVTFDFGQTLAELSTERLASRCQEQGAHVEVDRLEPNVSAAWHAYGRAKAEGAVGEAAWCTFMFTLLTRADCLPGDDLARRELVRWLWQEQPRENLWRRPVPGMFELVRQLQERGVRLGVVSNSEGKLRQLAEELGVADLFIVIVDSGVLGIEKPERGIFEYAAKSLGVRTDQLIHVGDSWEADVRGALGCGAKAIYFSEAPGPEEHPDVYWTSNASEVQRELERLGV